MIRIVLIMIGILLLAGCTKNNTCTCEERVGIKLDVPEGESTPLDLGQGTEENTTFLIGPMPEPPKCMLYVEDVYNELSMCVDGNGIEFCNSTNCWKIKGETYQGNWSELGDEDHG